MTPHSLDSYIYQCVWPVQWLKSNSFHSSTVVTWFASLSLCTIALFFRPSSLSTNHIDRQLHSPLCMLTRVAEQLIVKWMRHVFLHYWLWFTCSCLSNTLKYTAGNAVNDLQLNRLHFYLHFKVLVFTFQMTLDDSATSSKLNLLAGTYLTPSPVIHVTTISTMTSLSPQYLLLILFVSLSPALSPFSSPACGHSTSFVLFLISHRWLLRARYAWHLVSVTLEHNI